jgi:1-acylglycerone phosphate reductase
VNNAGAGGTGALLDFPIDQAKAVFETNLFAPMRLTQLVVPHMAKEKSGLIINIGSIVGEQHHLPARLLA